MHEHTNVFSQHATVQDAYKDFLSNQRENRKWFHRYTAAAAILFYTGLFWPDLSRHGFAFFAFLSAVSAFTALITFIDMSNRNFFLHVVDYLWERDNSN